MNRRIPRLVAAMSGVFIAAVAAAAPAGAHGRHHSEEEPVVIATGLNNPRHLSVGPGGALYVAESGTGGDGPCITSSEGALVCYGPTGSISELTRGRHGWSQRRTVSGLPSLAPPADVPGGPGEAPVAAGSNAVGPADVLVHAGRYVAAIGLGAPPAVRARGAATDPDGVGTATLPRGFGDLIEGRLPSPQHCHGRGWRHSRSHDCVPQWSVLADVAAFEARRNPVDEPDSNPASVVRIRGHHVVADAGGNTVLDVNARGRLSLVAGFEDSMVEFPPGSGQSMPMQFVPTAVAPGPHGSYFVSQLTGFPFPAGGSTIWQVTPARGHHDATVRPYATGLTNVTDLALAPGGDLYAVQISTTGLASEAGPTNGSLVRISRARGHAMTTVAGDLFAPYGVALAGRYAYVTTGSVLPGGGQVLQIPLGR